MSQERLSVLVMLSTEQELAIYRNKSEHVLAKFLYTPYAWAMANI